MAKFKTTIKPIIIIAMCIMLYLLAFLTPKIPIINADEVITNLDITNVLDDLNSSTVDGEPFNIDNYPYKANEKFSLFSFVEYCYTPNPQLQPNYNLYVYIYNPSAREINQTSQSNKIQLATKYNTNGNPTDYSKFTLEFCSRSSGNYTNLFYKFKIKNPSTILNRVNADPSKRRYDISGIELLINGTINATESGVGKTITFTGFASGLNNNTTSTLQHFPTELETIELDVKYTNFRPKGYSSAINIQDDLYSVYFEVPNKYINEYGNIKRIKAEWYEYKTAPILVTNDKALHEYMQNYAGVTVPSYDKNIRYSLNGDFKNKGTDYFPVIEYDWSWNKFIGKEGSVKYETKEIIQQIPYVFYKNVANIEDAIIPSEEVANYIYSYDKSFNKGTLQTKEQSISLDLFADNVDTDRTKGYNEKIFNADDESDWLDVASKDPRSRSQKFWQNLLFNTSKDLSEEFEDIAPIHIVGQEDLIGSLEQISKRLFVSQESVADLILRHSFTQIKDTSIVLLRFAVRDYNSSYTLVTDMETGKIDGKSAYLASETVFLDLDIIWLDFVKDGINTIIPVVANPIDVISGITPSVRVNDCTGFELDIPWWVWVIVGFVALCLIMAVFGWLGKFLKLLLTIMFFPFIIAYKLIKDKGGGG